MLSDAYGSIDDLRKLELVPKFDYGEKTGKGGNVPHRVRRFKLGSTSILGCLYGIVFGTLRVPVPLVIRLLPSIGHRTFMQITSPPFQTLWSRLTKFAPG